MSLADCQVGSSRLADIQNTRRCGLSVFCLVAIDGHVTATLYDDTEKASLLLQSRPGSLAVGRLSSSPR
jgi:hypothetical protein